MGGTLERVLYVEDDDDIRAVGTFALEGVGGLTVRGCASGAEAVAALASFAPQLLLLDVMMPGMDGPATLASLREHLGDLSAPAVFMTAKVQPRELAEYRALGVLEVIPKPFDPMTLAAQVRSIFERVS